MVSSAWYASWHANDFTLDDVPWDKYTHLTFAFKESTPDPSNITMSLDDSLLLYQFVARARQNDVKALLSLGGWAGSLYFSTNVGDAKNRTKLVNAVNELVTLYQLDGIDIDWEYPGHQGIGCNTISPNDTANLLSFLQELRSSPCGSNLILTAAVSLTPFANATDLPSTDVSEFAKVLDYIAIMNYDVWGSWSASVGPNAPLNDTCASPENQQGSAVSAVAAWTAAGMPPSQIALGVPSYGHSFSVNASSAFNGTNSKTELAPYPAFNASDFPVGDAWDDPPAVDACGVLESQGGTQDFWNLIDSGMINKDGTPTSDVPYRFDNCSQTEYVYNATASVMISYDGPKAFIAKGNFIKNTGLRGFAMWEAGGDKDDILLDAIRSGAGFDDCDD
ncbi:glycoside hydrolase [Fomitiporia mediterranea MF3/22]|uniref:glycoside hydrolase n=1 Tax=Fomitiporia mediterranea (strain MF3/22) TaxID=694068 RepID=UPI0004409996|nr:glycoside hydrolase [Fomitiporia mediterranea MF3/22]EJD03470.1 glycoside hydrolase [Fomitiporia mediterranea MF3/22]